jgi:hypothetical protein
MVFRQGEIGSTVPDKNGFRATGHLSACPLSGTGDFVIPAMQRSGTETTPTSGE